MSLLSARIRTLILPIISAILILSICSCENKSTKPIKILVVTGGHAYDTANFVKMFMQMDNIEFDTLIQPSANMLYSSEKINEYDALVFYDMYNEITEVQKDAFLDLLDGGIGVVFMHHSIGSYQDWEEYIHILGGRYDLDTSGYAHDLDITVDIVNEKHKITKGMQSFEIHDETYFNYKVLPEVKPILKTSHPESDELMAWTNEYLNSRIVYLQPGHDNNTYSNAKFRIVLGNAIRWVVN